jgi:DNA-binding NtrC family response regulator
MGLSMTATNAASITGDPQLAVVIDDDATIRDFMATTLAQLGMKVEIFQIAKEALASLDNRHPVIIFLDVALLQSDAIDVLRGLGERRYGGTVQLMSGGRPSLLEAVRRIGVRHGISLATPLNKPFAREAIVQIVENLPRHEP